MNIVGLILLSDVSDINYLYYGNKGSVYYYDCD